jgi:signal peptidase I
LSREVISPSKQDEFEARHTGALRFLKELPVLVVLALGIALLIKAFLVQAFYIPSASMEPTLRQGDRVLVNKLTYRFGEPKRGDVIVFRDPYPDQCDGAAGTPTPPSCNRSFVRHAFDWFAEVFGLPTGETRDFIKRIVALPGETIAIRDGNVFVCSAPACQPLNGDGTPKDGRRVAFAHSVNRGPQQDHDNVPAFAIPKGQYWVMGDNRANSSDSRTFKGVDRKLIIGKGFVLVWPPNRFRGL